MALAGRLLTPALLMTSVGMTVSISSAPLARITNALLEAIRKAANREEEGVLSALLWYESRTRND